MATDREKIAKRRQRRRRRRLKLSFKIFLCFVFLIAAGGAYIGIRNYQAKNAPDPFGKLEDVQNTPDNNYDLTDEVMIDAKYWVLNVGSGEAIYIKCEQTDILIDTGSEKDGKAVIDAIKGEIAGELDYLIISSTSGRRVGGLKAVCKDLKPSRIISCPLGERGVEIKKDTGGIKVEEGETTTLSLTKNGSLSMFLPEVSSKDPLDQSIMTLFKYGETSFFAESDAGEEEEARVIEQIAGCDALVLSRAGSDSVNQHVGDISCSTYVVSCKEGEGPSASLAETLNGSIFATYSSGTIQFSTNGKEVKANLDQQNRVNK